MKRPTLKGIGAKLFETGHEPSTDLRALEEDAIGFRGQRRYPLASARAATTDGAEIESKEYAEHGWGRACEAEHQPQRATHRTQEARRIGGSHPAEHAYDAYAARDERSASGRVRRTA